MACVDAGSGAINRRQHSQPDTVLPRIELEYL